MLSKPKCGTTEFQFDETVKYTLIATYCDIPFEWVDAAIDGLRRKREFTLLGRTDADENRVYCIVSRWNCHIIWEAIKWYKKSAVQNYPSAQYNLARCYERGIGVAVNLKAAFELYKKAAEQGMEKAQNNLGCCYEYGRGVAKDLSAAIMWYEKAASKGNAYSQYALGMFYKKGIVVKQNDQKAMEYFQKSANGGCLKAKIQILKTAISRE